MNCKEHLTDKGILKIVAISASINRGLNKGLKQAFWDVKPVQRPVVKLPKNLDPNWLSGFSTGEACFFINIFNSQNSKLGKVVSLIFILTQHERDRELLNCIIKYLNCGRLITSLNANRVRISRFQDIKNIIVPFFNKYPIQGNKRLDFLDFCKVVDLIEKNKYYLTSGGLDQILLIKSGMNTDRDNITFSCDNNLDSEI